MKKTTPRIVQRHRSLWIGLAICLLAGMGETVAQGATSRLVQKATSRPAQKSICPNSTGQPLFRSGVARAVVWQKHIALLEPSLRTLVVRDAHTGRKVWHKTFQKQPSGAHSLHIARSQLVVYAGARLFSFATKTGALLGQRNVRWQQHERHQEGCTFVYRHGACGLSCGDEFQLIHCETMYPMSAAYALTRTCFSGNCFSFRGQVVGAAQQLWLAEVEEPKRTSSSGEGRRKRMIVAVHRKTGQEMWESNDAAVLLWHPEESGFSPDQKVCWLANYTGETSVFNCQTGEVWWRLPSKPQRNVGSLMHRHLRWHSAPPGLISLTRQHISLREIRTGKVLWQRPLESHTLAIWQGGLRPPSQHTLKHRTTWLVLSPQHGTILHKHTVEAGHRVWVFPQQQLVTEQHQRLTWYVRGQTKTAQVPFIVTDIFPTRSGWIVMGSHQLRIVRETDGRVLFDLAGSWQVKATESTLGQGRILLQSKSVPSSSRTELVLFAFCHKP